MSGAGHCTAPCVHFYTNVGTAGPTHGLRIFRRGEPSWCLTRISHPLFLTMTDTIAGPDAQYSEAGGGAFAGSEFRHQRAGVRDEPVAAHRHRLCIPGVADDLLGSTRKELKRDAPACVAALCRSPRRIKVRAMSRRFRPLSLFVLASRSCRRRTSQPRSRAQTPEGWSILQGAGALQVDYPAGLFSVERGSDRKGRGAEIPQRGRPRRIRGLFAREYGQGFARRLFAQKPAGAAVEVSSTGG